MKSTTKKVLLIGLAVLLLTMAAFASANNNQAYNDFKQMFKEVDKIQDEQGSALFSMSLTDNDQNIISLSGEMVGNKIDEKVSGVVDIKACARLLAINRGSAL